MNEIILDAKVTSETKYRKLFLCLALDAVGYFSYIIPFLGEFTDLVWAPLAALLITQMFKGAVGKVGGVFAFIEEIMPGLDFIPTFTITWFYTNFLSKNKN